MRPISDVRVPGDPTISPDGSWLISDQLARKGMAVLRINRRGVGGSGGGLDESTLSDLVGDAAKAISFLRAQDGIDGQQIGIIGFGDGGVIVPEIASSHKGIQCMVLLGTPGLPELELFGRSARRKLKVPLAVDQRISAATEWDLEKSSLERIRREERILTLSRDGRTPHQIWATLSTELTLPRVDVREPFGEFIDLWTTDYNRSLLRYDPRDWLRKVTVPSFVAAGELDVRTCPEENVPEIKRCLEERCKDVMVRVYSGLSHSLVWPARMDYNHLVYEIDLTQETILDPQVLADVVDWISGHLAIGERQGK